MTPAQRPGKPPGYRQAPVRDTGTLASPQGSVDPGAVAHSLPVAMFAIDASHRVISWNRALETFSGIGAGEVLGTRMHWKAFYPSERPCLADLLVDGTPEKIPEFYDGRWKQSDVVQGAMEADGFFPGPGPGGTWLRFIAAPIRDAGGNLVGATEILDDITGLMQARQDLTESESRYSALFTNNPSVTLLLDPDTGRIVEANESAERYYGYPPGKLATMAIYDLNRHPRETVIRNLGRAKDEKEKHFHSAHYRAGGEKRHVEVYSGPIQVRGKPLFYSIIHDITDRNRAETALRESEERYRTLIDQLPDYVIVHRDGVLLYTNPAAASQFGYPVEHIIGKSIFAFIAPGYHEGVRRAMVQRMQGEKFPAYEMKIRAADGTYRTVLTNGAAIMYGGKPASLNVLSDITALKEAEEMIRRSNEDLEKRVMERTEALSRANDQLVAEISARTRAEQEIIRSLDEKDLLLREIHHRVKNNLQIIASLLKLQSRTISDPNILEAIKNSQSRIRAMALVHERIYRSHSIAEINLGDYLDYLTRQILQFYNIPQRQVAITVTMPAIMADIDTITPLGLIVNELVSNSLKYAFPGGRKGMISIECSIPEPDLIRMVYHDNGIGLPPGLDWRNTESLGLRLVNSLVDQLDGTIEGRSGEGTMFVITARQKHGPPPPS